MESKTGLTRHKCSLMECTQKDQAMNVKVDNHRTYYFSILQIQHYIRIRYRIV